MPRVGILRTSAFNATIFWRCHVTTATETRKGAPVRGLQLERGFMFQRESINEETRTCELAFSSEAPYQRWWGVEILDHSAEAIDLTRLKSGGPVLCDHDTRDQVGVIESVRIDADRVGRAVVRFGRSARAEEIFRDVVDGIRKNVSVGYSIDDLVLEAKSGDEETYRVTRWTPYEVSLVSVPADFTVGVGRAAENHNQEIKMQVETTTTQVDVAKLQAEARSAEQKRAAEIIAIGQQFKLENMAAEAVRSGAPVEAFRADVMNKLASQPLPAASSDLGLSQTENKRYSLLRAVRAMVDRDWTAAGYERELHQEICKRAGIAEAPNGGFFVPYDVQKRDMTATTGNAGGYLVATDNLGGSFIDLLRKRALVAKLGATMLTGLQGNVTIPKLTAGGTAYWLTNEATAITESQQTLGQLALTPKNVGAYTEISRQLMMQSSPAADSLVMNDLAKVLALAIDLAAFEGSGASGQPTGISNTAGIGSVTGTSIAYAGIIEFQTDVAGSEALAENCAYVTTPAVAGLLAQRQRFTSTDTPLWQGTVLDGQMAGYRAASTNQVTAASMVFGDFSQVVIGEWGMLELALNPYANFAAAISGIRAIQTVDVGIRIPGAFSRATSIT
jgi:HK97 family phage major capsid protein